MEEIDPSAFGTWDRDLRAALAQVDRGSATQQLGQRGEPKPEA
jgi:hypothetical protein